MSTRPEPDHAAAGAMASPATPPPEPGPDRPDDRTGREPGDLDLAMSPRQIIGGFALLAGLILLVRRRRRPKV